MIGSKRAPYPLPILWRFTVVRVNIFHHLANIVSVIKPSSNQILLDSLNVTPSTAMCNVVRYVN